MMIVLAVLVVLTGCSSPAENINAAVQQVRDNAACIRAECADGIGKIDAGKDAKPNFKRIDVMAETIDEAAAGVPSEVTKQEDALERAKTGASKLWLITLAGVLCIVGAAVVGWLFREALPVVGLAAAGMCLLAVAMFPKVLLWGFIISGAALLTCVVYLAWKAGWLSDWKDWTWSRVTSVVNGVDAAKAVDPAAAKVVTDAIAAQGASENTAELVAEVRKERVP